ncbi:DUF72 domain-containing protein [Flavobacterium sp. ov086]|uniref:DUF72 domain-containing protein n=1 Tax=Flavobacterium sp. ov086 TaxID=1761785 RepID=UPI001595DA35
MPKEITRIRKFIDYETLISDFYNVCKLGLKMKFGCVLFQLSPSYDFSSEKFNQIISNLDLKFKNVAEFRYES